MCCADTMNIISRKLLIFVVIYVEEYYEYLANDIYAMFMVHQLENLIIPW